MTTDSNAGQGAESFQLERRPDGGQTLVVTGDWTASAAALLRDGSADELELNYARGFRERSLDFLEDWPLRRLSILSRTLCDIAPLYRLSSTLTSLQLTTDPRTALDCERLPGLQAISVENWPQIAGSVEALDRLEDIFVYRYPERTFTALSGNTRLRKLRVKQARLENLAGLAYFPDLEELEVVGPRDLVDISPLEHCNPGLRRLRFDSCKHIARLDAAHHLTRLHEIWVADCGHIASLAPLAAMTDLQIIEAYESTVIDDGDLSVLLGLTKLRRIGMRSRKFYKPSVENVKAELGIEE